ncbi:Iron-type alcohol dehydrogenase-like protein, partial [Aduncisulcus paluster]
MQFPTKKLHASLVFQSVVTPFAVCNNRTGQTKRSEANMKLFSMNTELHRFDNLVEFTEAFSLGESDLILTSRGMHKRSLAPLNLPCRYIFHDDYGKGEPTNKKIDALLSDAGQNPFERIIAIGGGSVLDIAKILSLKNVEKSQDAFERKLELKKEHELICVPTTCGTGSEVTNISIMEIPEKSTKMGLADPLLIPDHAILIPELLLDL